MKQAQDLGGMGKDEGSRPSLRLENSYVWVEHALYQDHKNHASLENPVAQIAMTYHPPWHLFFLVQFEALTLYTQSLEHVDVVPFNRLIAYNSHQFSRRVTVSRLRLNVIRALLLILNLKGDNLIVLVAESLV